MESAPSEGPTEFSSSGFPPAGSEPDRRYRDRSVASSSLPRPMMRPESSILSLMVATLTIWLSRITVALLAQGGEPLIEQNIYLLLQQYLLDAGRDFFEGRNRFAASVFRQKRLVVVGFDVLQRDANAGPETLFDKAQDLKTEVQ